MKIVLTTTLPDLDAQVDPRFGRGAYFVVVDTESMEWQAHENPGVGAAGGAGTQAAQFIARQNAEAVMSGDFGPNAYSALEAAGIGMYLYGDCQTGRDAVEMFKAEKPALVGAPTGRGHHGPGNQ